LVGTERTDVKPDAESKFRGEEQRRAADGDVGEGGGWACLDTFFFPLEKDQNILVLKGYETLGYFQKS